MKIDAVPLTPDGQIDLDAAEAMLTEEHRVVAFAHVSNVLGSILDAKRAAEIAHSKGALLLLDGCQAVPRMPVDVAAIDADFYAFSAHKLYGPTGIGCLWGRAELLARNAAVAGRRRDDREGDVRGDHLPRSAGAVRSRHAAHRRRGRAARGGQLGREARPRRDPRARMRAGRRDAATRCRASRGVTLYGPEDSAGIVSFNVDGVHPHDTATILDDAGVAVRAGHHCAQPLMRWLGVEATARASFAAHSDSSDIEALVRGIEQVKRIFG